MNDCPAALTAVGDAVTVVKAPDEVPHSKETAGDVSPGPKLVTVPVRVAEVVPAYAAEQVTVKADCALYRLRLVMPPLVNVAVCGTSTPFT